MSKVRDPFFDVVKAFAIALVVFCHIAVMAPRGTFPQALENFRVGMNMPIFFVMSGYFAWPTIEKFDWRKLGAHLRSYFQPALFFSLIFLALGLALGLVAATPRDIMVAFVRGIFVDPWFITTLAECYVFSFAAYWIERSVPRMLGLLALLIAAVVCRPMTAGAIHFSCLVNMLPCFLFGALVLRKGGMHVWEAKVLGLVCLVLFTGSVALEGNVHANGMSFYTADVSWRALANGNGALTFVLRPLVGIVGSVGVMALIRILLDRLPKLKCLAPLGTMTLGIYIFHLWPLEQLKTMPDVAANPVRVALVAGGLLLFSAGVIWFLTNCTGRFSKWIWGK